GRGGGGAGGPAPARGLAGGCGVAPPLVEHRLLVANRPFHRAVGLRQVAGLLAGRVDAPERPAARLESQQAVVRRAERGTRAVAGNRAGRGRLTRAAEAQHRLGQEPERLAREGLFGFRRGGAARRARRGHATSFSASAGASAERRRSPTSTLPGMPLPCAFSSCAMSMSCARWETA